MVCRRWHSFNLFLMDMGRKPSPSHSLNRLDNDGPYHPGNCVWSTKLEQDNNRRTNTLVTFEGVTLTMAQWARRLGINYQTLCSRFSYDWPLDRILSSRVAPRRQAHP